MFFTHKKLPGKYRCAHCSFCFATTVGAMVAHSKSHKNAEIVRIFKVTRKAGKTILFRPEEHSVNKAKDEFSAGNATLHEVIIPVGMLNNTENTITCRGCKKYDIDYDVNALGLHTLGRRALKMKRHERACAEKMKKTNK